MKKLLLIITAVQFGLAAIGQDFFSQTVVASGGGQTSNATYQTSWTIGEAITSTESIGGGVLSQGFQQGPLFYVLTWTGATSVNWNTAGNWSPERVPTYESNAAIPVVLTQYPTVNESPSAPAACNNLTIQAGAPVVTIAPAKALTVNGTLSNLSGVEGLKLESTTDGTGSLIHYTAGVDATLQRFVTGSSSLTLKLYHQVSVPLVPANNSLSSLFLGSYLYHFDVAANNWIALGTPTTNVLDETRGYMIYRPTATHTYTFEGQMNAGEFTPLATYEGQGYNLVPNPYPSAINWDAAGWTKTGIANAVYLWPAGGSSYISYVDGVVVPEGTQNPGIIPAGQSFFVKATASPTFKMTDAVRLHSGRAFQKSGDNLPNLLRIMASGNELTDEAVVRFREMATANADPEFDAWKIAGSEGAPQLSTTAADNQKLVINALPLFEESSVVPLNFEMSASKPVTLTFTNLESFDAATSIFLKDELANQTINLRNQPVYEFSHNAGNAPGRFKLVFGGTIGVEETEIQSENYMWIAENALYINTPQLTGEKGLLEVFDASGKCLMQKQLVLSEFLTENLPQNGFVIVKLTSGQEIITVKGIVTNQ
jgi:hypothetical protein